MTIPALAVLNAWFYTLLAAYSLVAIPALTLYVACRAPFSPHRASMRRFRRAIRWYGYGIIHALAFPWIRVRYEDRSGDASAGPFVFVCNHLSASDPFLMAVIAHEGVQVANTWPLRLPVWGVAARLAGYLSVNDMPVEEFFARARRLLADGVSLVVFPEGTRSRGHGVGPFHGAAFRLALQQKVPIAPLVLHGNERMPPRGSILLRPGLVRVRRLPTLAWEDFRTLSPFQLKNRVRDLIAEASDAMKRAA